MVAARAYNLLGKVVNRPLLGSERRHAPVSLLLVQRRRNSRRGTGRNSHFRVEWAL